jgi:hypothetical protein
MKEEDKPKTAFYVGHLGFFNVIVWPLALQTLKPRFSAL